LLARSSQRGYIELDPDRPELQAHRVMFREPEPVPPPEADALNHRVQQTIVFKAWIAVVTDELAVGACRADQHHLRAIRHHAAEL
jgi:hypothetical protein